MTTHSAATYIKGVASYAMLLQKIKLSCRIFYKNISVCDLYLSDVGYIRFRNAGCGSGEQKEIKKRKVISVNTSFISGVLKDAVEGQINKHHCLKKQTVIKSFSSPFVLKKPNQQITPV